MPSVVMTITRDDTSKEWFDPKPENWSKYFTQEEIDTVISPVHNTYMSLPGLLGNRIVDVDEKTRKVYTDYDTIENCRNAVLERHGNNPLMQQRRELIANKRSELGVSYIFTYGVE